MKFGLTHANIGRFVRPETASELARAAETAGFESLWTVEHVVLPTEYEPLYPETPDGRLPFETTHPIADPLMWMTYVGAHTERIRLGTAVLVLPQRNPLVTAKAVATADLLLGGRLILGVGAGWLREEFAALGAHCAGRAATLTESILAMRALWSGEPATFTGSTTSFTGVVSSPAPPRKAVPIHIGGYSVPAAVRAGRIGDGFFPGGYGDREKLTMLVTRARKEAVDAGRDPAALEITARWTKDPAALDDVGVLHEMEDLGIDRIVVPASVFAGDDDLVGAVARFGERVIGAHA
jgi:probable F420-dependent oxidoreductase